jgi:hypothetical protein
LSDICRLGHPVGSEHGTCPCRTPADCRQHSTCEGCGESLFNGPDPWVLKLRAQSDGSIHFAHHDCVALLPAGEA